jgi:TetR/AcrR family transcriptional regulator
MARVISGNFLQQKGMLLDAAVRAFAEEGFSRASMTRIAAGAGVSKALIYHYYPGKEMLLYESMLRYLSGLLAALGAGTGRHRSAHMAVTLDRLLAQYRAGRHDHVVLMSELRNLPQPQRTQIVQLQRQVLETMRRAVARTEPSIAPGDLHAVTLLVMGMVNWLHTWYREDGPVSHERLQFLVQRMVGGALHAAAAAAGEGA